MPDQRTIHVSLVATPEVDVSALGGLHGVLNSVAHMVPDTVSFRANVVVPDSVLECAEPGGNIITNVMGMPLPMQTRLSKVDQTDVLIIPSLYLLTSNWPRDPYPDLTEWIRRMHQRGSLICSACTGAMLLAETGLLDDHEATQHWAFEALFREHFPRVRLNIDKVLLITGASNRIIMSGASAAWHDLVLYLIARYSSPQAARVIAKFFLLNSHTDGQAPYIIFQDNRQHGDGVILAAQQWLHAHSHLPRPLKQAQQNSGLSARTFSRRFCQATGLSPIHYVQQLRITQAKSELEETDTPVDEISWRVGYEDPAFFRRLFKRITGMTPKMYRRKFQLPDPGRSR
ncbi:helix-turn-helix domain-containing protein [Sedimenticola selenatireducens]|uniref:GlxA family transcriptional regulator n=1 Tax=Sedimenticola selenatireducens TaxID=191960 RepID=UPI002AAB6D23|nr:helix-turn-helix domain-containing protein [Sedimenticola selenatireducens]